MPILTLANADAMTEGTHLYVDTSYPHPSIWRGVYAWICRKPRPMVYRVERYKVTKVLSSHTIEVEEDPV